LKLDESPLQIRNLELDTVQFEQRCRGAASFSGGTEFPKHNAKKDVLWEAQTAEILVLDARI
jgi:hypothetical protein